MEKFSIRDVLRGLCPRCRGAKVSGGFLHIRRRCPNCDLDLYPEPGYYLGAMMAGFLIAAMMLIPTILILKISDVDPTWLLMGPIIQYVILAPVITFYSKILWLHGEHALSNHWNRGDKP